jgi:hypothetical protein
MVCEVSPNFQSFLFQTELARMQAARLKRIAEEFDLLVKSEAVFLENASPDDGRVNRLSKANVTSSRGWKGPPPSCAAGPSTRKLTILLPYPDWR